MLMTYSEKNVNNYQGPVGKEYLFAIGGVYEVDGNVVLRRLITWVELDELNLTAKEYVDLVLAQEGQSV